MSDKPLAFFFYALFGIFLALSPVVFSLLAKPGASAAALVQGDNRLVQGLCAGLSALVLGLLILLGGVQALVVVVCAILALWVAWRANTSLLVALPALCAVFVASTKLIWWEPLAETITLPVLVATFAVFALALEFLISRRVTVKSGASPKAEWAALIVFGGLCLFFGFSTGLLGLDEILFTTWHHWGAYVGPAELMWAGARIFYDSPAQYGLGPTTLIALSCPFDCWKGMYYIVGTANVLYAAAVAFVALRLLGRDRTVGMAIAALAATFAACFLYPAYPPSPATPSISPSTGGLRFLPCAILVAYLVSGAEQAWSWRQRVAGHLIWAFGLLWAPESAFHVTFVWWPYYLWRSIDDGQGGLHGLGTVLKHAGRLGLILVATVALFVSTYYALFRVLPTADGVFAYILYPPGPVPFEFRGAFLYFGGVVFLTAVSITALTRRDESPVFLRRAVLVLLALYAVASYYLGRSIDNNLLNIMPFVVLALLVAAAPPFRPQFNALGATAVSCVIALTLSFGWRVCWGPALAQSHAFEVDPRMARKAFDLAISDTTTALDRRERARNPLVHSADVQRAAAQIWATYHESVTLMAPPLVLMTSFAAPWNALHAPENFFSIPKASRRTFLTRAMRRFNRAGWTIIQEGTPDIVAAGGRELAEDFDAVYTRDISLSFGSYTAIRYLPKPAEINSLTSVDETIGPDTATSIDNARAPEIVSPVASTTWCPASSRRSVDWAQLWEK